MQHEPTTITIKETHKQTTKQTHNTTNKLIPQQQKQGKETGGGDGREERERKTADIRKHKKHRTPQRNTDRPRITQRTAESNTK